MVVFSGCLWWLSLVVVFSGCLWWLSLVVVFGGCLWWLSLVVAADGNYTYGRRNGLPAVDLHQSPLLYLHSHTNILVHFCTLQACVNVNKVQGYCAYAGVCVCLYVSVYVSHSLFYVYTIMQVASRWLPFLRVLPVLATRLGRGIALRKSLMT